MAARPKYHFSNLTRTDAERLLLQNGTNGAFLVRDSESVAGACVLSVFVEGRVQHYRVKTEAGGVRMEGLVKTFPSIADLVSYCRTYDTLCGVKLQAAIEGQQEEAEAPMDELVEEEDAEGVCATAFLLQEAFKTLEPSQPEDLRPFSRYIVEHVCADSEAAKRTPSNPEHFRHLLLTLSAEASHELAALASKLQRIRSVLLSAGGFGPSEILTAPPPSDNTLEALLYRFQHTKDLLLDTDRHAERFLREMTCEHSSASAPAHQPAASPAAKEPTHRGVRVFDVKRVEKRVVAVRTTLTADSIGRSVTTGRGTGSSEDDRLYPIAQVVQLIKSRSDKARLGLRLEGKKRKDYVFTDAQAREDFCQIVQLMKNQDWGDDQFEKLSLFVGTFNMGEAAPPSSLTSWLTSQGEGMTLNLSEAAHDMYVIGTQESALSEKEWSALIKRHLGDNFTQIASEQLWQIRIVIFARAALASKISHVQTSSAATGIANALGNKGAVGVSLSVGTTHLCFINCHLAAGAEKWARRKANYGDILTKLQLGQKRLVGFDVTNQFHHVFWMGDMNYRLNFPIKTILENIASRNWPFLRKADQLIRSRKAGEVFCGFDEGELTFPPTYRYERGTRDSYKWNKQKATHVKINVPSWCDRVLWKSFPNLFAVQTSYGCPNDIMTSDHSPVFATFSLEISNQYVSRLVQDPHVAPCQIVIAQCTAQLLSPSKTRFYLDFFASFVQETARSAVNRRFASEGSASDKAPSGSMPSWEDVELPLVRPIIPDRLYLEMEHLLVAVRSEDSDESYGVACIPLMAHFGPRPVPFSCKLTHRGEFAGELTGMMVIENSLGEGRAQSIINADDDEYYRFSMMGEDPAARPTSRLLSPSESLSALSPDASRHPSLAAPPPSSSLPVPSPSAGGAGGAGAGAGTVKGWLGSLGLAHLTAVFIDNGFDDLKFLNGIEQGDLVSMGVTDPAAQRAILTAARKLTA